LCVEIAGVVEISNLDTTLPMTTLELAAILTTMGCPAEKSGEMASQLQKRARQLAEQTKRTSDEALLHLLDLMKQGWAAKASLVPGATEA